MNTQRQLINAAHENWNNNRGVDTEVMRDLGYDTPETLPVTIKRVIGQEATAQSAQLELVTEEHEPQPGAHREAKLREPRPARTAKEKADRDRSQALEHKTPPEWTPYIRST